MVEVPSKYLLRMDYCLLGRKSTIPIYRLQNKFLCRGASCSIMPVRTYPVAAIEDGIKMSVKKSEELLDTAKMLFKEDKPNYAVVIYSYAVEEFGKAVLLTQIKNAAVAESAEIVYDEVTFGDHTVKFEEAGHEISDRAKIKKWEFPIGEFGEPKDMGEFLSEENRLKLLLVDYDEVKGKWKDEPDDIPTPFLMPLQDALEVFGKDIAKWKESYLT